MLATLNCTVSLSPVVDTPITVSVVWKKNGNPISSAECLLSVSPSEVSPGVYHSLLLFRPLGWLIDDGNYLCEVNVTSDPALSDETSLLGTGIYSCNY